MDIILFAHTHTYDYVKSKGESIMRKLTLLSLCTITAIGLLAGCSSSSNNTQSSTPQTSLESTTEENSTNASSEGVTITHSKGTTTVPFNPQKVVVFDMGVLDTLNTLGVDAEFAVPTASLPDSLKEYESATNAGGIKEPDMEGIFEFEPDVIFISGRQSDFYDELNKIAPTVYVDLNAATYMEDFTKNATYLAEIFGKTEELTTHLDEINGLIKEGQALADATDKKGLIILTNDGSMSAYGKGSRFGIIHDVLNVKVADENIEVSTHGQEASYEYIAQVNPDILFVVDRATVTGGTTLAETTLNNDLVNGTNAAKDGKIIYLDAESWYLSGGGIAAVKTMVSEVVNALK